MKQFTRIVLGVLGVMLFTACGTAAQASSGVIQGKNPYPPQPGDSAMMRQDVSIDSATVSLQGSNPQQAVLHFAYRPPTPCYSLRVEVAQPDAQGRINVSAYGVAEKDKACTLMALATPLQAELSLGSYPKGHYSVWLNGAKAGEFGF
jgi:hypothetical protein